MSLVFSLLLFFFFNDTATTEIYTLSLHDALPISEPAHGGERAHRAADSADHRLRERRVRFHRPGRGRSEEHTSELQSQSNIVCRLLLEKKKNNPRRTCQSSKASTAARKRTHISQT